MVCAVFLLVKENQFLVEERTPEKRAFEGELSIPGGRCENDESPVEALKREAQEELGIQVTGFFPLCILEQSFSGEKRILHYFVVTHWNGTIRALEAETVRWIGFSQSKTLSLPADQEAIKQYLALKKK